MLRRLWQVKSQAKAVVGVSRRQTALNAVGSTLIRYSCRHLIGQERQERELECQAEFEHILGRSDITCKLHKTVFALLFAEDLARGNRLLPYGDGPEGSPLVPPNRTSGFAVIARYCWGHASSLIHLTTLRVRASLIVGVLACLVVSVLFGGLVGILASSGLIAAVSACAGLLLLLVACRLTTERASGPKRPVPPSSTVVR
jgi:hypothetical protein